MLYQAIRDARKRYHSCGYGNDYCSTLEELCSWNRKEPPSKGQVGSIRSLVNSWGTRMQAKTCELHSTLEFIWGELLELESKSIITVNLCNDTVRNSISNCFDRVAKSNAKRRNEATGASKILHIINPELFVMWDGAIRGGYGFSGKYGGKQYVGFLRRMQRLANYAISQVEKECCVSRKKAIESLKCEGHTLAKALDEYNYVNLCRRWKSPMRNERLWNDG